MNLIKMNGTKAELRNRYGNLVRIISESAQNAYLNQTCQFVVITTLNGVVELRNINGNLVRNITSGATDARFYGSDILISKGRKSELRNINGLLIRNI